MTTELMGALRRYWGYESFRPMQERIVSNLLSGRDVCVVMPTGGGKSLCYQLPAAVSPGRTVVVVSPLIALMQDQVAQLTQIGIPAASLNSSMNQAEQSRVMHGATRGEFRLVYLSPERLAPARTVEWLRRVPLHSFVIDEAHCISEWGHEFRPEYRQLNSLRDRFADVPIAAFTASATRRVRHDIVDQLKLRDPAKFIASFHRPNLSYLARLCEANEQRTLLMRALKQHSGEAVIIYAPTIARVEQTVEWLQEKGIEAIEYHGQMDHEARQKNQEQWMAGEVPVLVGTIAFGLGINKPDVRAVIHLSLPKSIEQYYQEAGRAGRDGMAADCLLLWQKRDVGLLAHFIGQLNDPAERDAAWQRYHTIRAFAESHACRHRQICVHFGESPKWESCQACDVCVGHPEWLEAASRHALPKPQRRKTHSDEGEDKPVAAKAKRSKRADVDGLRARLREWRRVVAKERGVPAFVVMHDTSLDDLCEKMPKSAAELREVHGFGEKKTAEYGSEILRIVAEGC